MSEAKEQRAFGREVRLLVLGTVLGAVLALGGGLITQYLQAQAEIKRYFVAERLTALRELSKACAKWVRRQSEINRLQEHYAYLAKGKDFDSLVKTLQAIYRERDDARSDWVEWPAMMASIEALFALELSKTYVDFEPLLSDQIDYDQLTRGVGPTRVAELRKQLDEMLPTMRDTVKGFAEACKGSLQALRGALTK